MTKKLCELCDFIKGEVGIAKAIPGQYPLVTTGAERKTCNTYQFDTKAVCLPTISSAGHGKKSLNYVHYQEDKFALGTILVAVIPKNSDELSAKYLHLYLFYFKDYLLVPLMKGAANVSLPIKEVKKIKIPVPPIQKQLKLTSLIKTIDSDYSNILKENGYQIKLLKQLRQAILQEAVEGKLTDDWRKQHPELISGENHASCLLEKIKAEKERLIKEGKIKKQKPLPPISNDEKPSDLPEGWVWCRLGEVGLFERGKSKHRPRNAVFLFKNGTYPFVQTGDVSQSKKAKNIIKTFSKLYNELGLKQSRLWFKDTLCITIAANIAETGLLGFDACFPDSIVGFTTLTNIFTTKYIRMFFEVIQENIIKFAPATAQKNINLGIIWNLSLSLPPLPEQQTIVEKVDRLMAKIDAMEAQVNERKEQAEQLMQAVLREAFNGG